MSSLFSVERVLATFLGCVLIISSLYFVPTSRYAPLVRQQAEAATLELLGYAWSDTIGWISVNCANTSSCATSDYKLVLDTVSNNVTGFAWSEHVGWIEFGGAAASGCPSGTCQARKVGSELSGWARVNNGDGIAPDVEVTIPVTTPGSQVFSPTSTTWQVPTGVTAITVKAWGAGGGSGGGNRASPSRLGGGAGFAQATIVTTPGETLIVQVGTGGGGGKGASSAPVPDPGTAGVPGGSEGGKPSGCGFITPCATGGGGGGYSGVFRGTISLANALVIAGAGAGGGGSSQSYTAGVGGVGGGTTGGNGGGPSYGSGGTQSAGGTSGGGSGAPADGSALAGGKGGAGMSFGGGGGGGGYYGGGGGRGADNANSSGGGGGSGYVNVAGTLTQGSGVTPANTGDSDYISGVGVGGLVPGSGINGADGGNGRVVINYIATTTATGTAPAPLNGTDGWISLNCANSGTCGTSNFKVDIGSSELSGYAWGSDVVGWISFNCSNTGTCATSNYRVYFNPPCSVSNVCSGDHAQSTHTDAWCVQVTTTCSPGYICKDVDGLCGYGDPTGTLTVASNKVRKGSTVNVTWSTQYASNCTVAGTNGDSWSPASSSAQITSALNNEVTYTLRCEPVGGGTPVLLDTERITLIPIIKEI